MKQKIRTDRRVVGFLGCWVGQTTEQKQEIQDTAGRRRGRRLHSPALEARLAQALVQALAERTARDLGVKLAAQSRVAVTLECCIWPTAAGEEVRGN